ncbi:group 1 glycosyl transferase [Halogeometricum pallidum JCM 14848]|uniref:Group 1 glycosyl transferase n=1 Tax=Halogeometricum pallidum JCM 14848 TaxID=1227487 RepID=M0D925_HALPD|nr:glycosyltransferase family 4 protein [Halogeometricum pallidum]ELZ31328.1 group 1 glycosyl transferase [Halogeometricum pallidum JCM 14848]
MRVLVVTSTNNGGILRHATQVSDKMATKTDNCRILLPSDGDFETDSLRSTVRFVPSGLLSDTESGSPLLLVWQFCVYFVYMLFHVRSSRPDVVYCAEWFPCAVISKVLEPFFSHRTAVVAHGAEVVFLEDDSKYKRLMKPVQRRVLNASLVFAVSEYTADQLRDNGVRDITLCYNGIDLAHRESENSVQVDDENEPVRTALSEAAAHPTLLTVSRLQRYKGQDKVIECLPQLAEEFPDLRYVVVGKGEDMEYMKSVADEHGVSDRVIFTGFVADELVTRLYELADIYVMPTRIHTKGLEGFGISFLEAYATKTPVIGPTVGGPRSAVIDGETGLLVNPDNTDEIEAAIRDLLSDEKKRARLGDRGYEELHGRFSWDAVSDLLLDRFTAHAR